MMRHFLPLTALALGLSSGVALADRAEHAAPAPHPHEVVRDHRQPVVVHERPVVVHERVVHERPVVVHERPVVRERVVVREPRGGHVVVRGGVTYRPIYVERPVIRAHYYNRWHRPAVIVEHYGPRPGYLWVGGGWTWYGGEWIWTAGYYQPI
jgi:hypothetical protein